LDVKTGMMILSLSSKLKMYVEHQYYNYTLLTFYYYYKCLKNNYTINNDTPNKPII